MRRAGRFLLRNSSEGTFDLDVTLRGIGAAYGARIEALIMMEGMSYVVTHADGRQRAGVVHAQPTLERLDQVSEFKDLDPRISAGGADRRRGRRRPGRAGAGRARRTRCGRGSSG